MAGDTFRIPLLTVIGVGLIGGSLARALREAGVVDRIIGVGRSRDSLDAALDAGIIDEATTDAGGAVRDADVVVIAAPLAATDAVLGRIARALPAKAVVTDVGSVKQSVVEAARARLGDALPAFVPAHPVAGSEQSGPAASSASLFRGHTVILSPLDETRLQAVEDVRRMWEATGADVLMMSAAEHDQILAAVSHLPHVAAYAIVDLLARIGDVDELFGLAGGGFRDFTRIASSEGTMWRDICLANRDALVPLMRQYSEALAGLADSLERGDGEALLRVFRHARDSRHRGLANQPHRPPGGSTGRP